MRRSTHHIRRFSERLISTVHRGTAFEYRAQAFLTEHMSMSLTRVGGSHDGGVDLIGWWWLPEPDPDLDGGENNPSPSSSSHPLEAATTAVAVAEPRAWNDATNRRRRLRVLAQCKAEKRKMGPAYLRELEGVVYRHVASAAAAAATATASIPDDAFLRRVPVPQGDPIPPVALFVSQSAFTRSCLDAAYASRLPFLLVHLPPSTSTSTSTSTSNSSTSASSTDILGTIFGNPALVSTRGILGGQLEIRWERGVQATYSGGDGGGSVEGGGGLPGLWWQGQPLPSWTPDDDRE